MLGYMQTLQHIHSIVASWPSRSRKVARDMIEKYGLPHEATESRLIWRYNGPWKQTIVHSDGMQHNFPRPHHDILEQSVDYRVPADRVADVIEFGASVLVDRTRGEIVANCDSEARNMLMLSQVHEICIGAKTPEQARATVKEQAAVIRFGWQKSHSDALGFAQGLDVDREKGTADPGSRAAGVYHR